MKTRTITIAAVAAIVLTAAGAAGITITNLQSDLTALQAEVDTQAVELAAAQEPQNTAIAIDNVDGLQDRIDSLSSAVVEVAGLARDTDVRLTQAQRQTTGPTSAEWAFLQNDISTLKRDLSSTSDRVDSICSKLRYSDLDLAPIFC